MTDRGLYLVLKRIWYEEIDCGNKRIEYRGDTQYWRSRLIQTLRGGKLIKGAWGWNSDLQFPTPYKIVEFRHGYRRDARRMRFKIREIVLPSDSDSGKFEIHIGERLS